MTVKSENTSLLMSSKHFSARCFLAYYLMVVYDRWFIPVNVVLAAVFGCLLGYAVALLIKPPPEFFNFTVVFIGIGTQATTTFLFNFEDSLNFYSKAGEDWFSCLLADLGWGEL
jgi:hypothetical protein